MHLYHKSVCAAGGCRQRHGLYELRCSCGVAGVHDDGKVGQLLQHGDGGQVEDVSCVLGIEGADASFAEDDVLVAACHDIFGGHEPLLDGCGESALEQNWLICSAELLEQLEVLHISRSYLDHVNVFKEGEVVGAHYFGDYGETGLLFGFEQDIDSLGVESLEIIGGGSGLECAAAEHRCACGFDGFGYLQHLLVAFYGARACHYGELVAADGCIAYLYNTVVGVKLAVCAFEGLGDSVDLLNYVETAEKILIDSAGVSYETYDGLELSLGEVYGKAL